MGEVNDIMLLFVTYNSWTRSFTLGYWPFYFSSVYDSNEDKNLCRENILSNEYVCCLSTINHTVDSQLVTIGSCIMLHQVVRSTKVRHMNLFLYLKSVLTYESHTQQTLGSRYNQLSLSVIPHFWLCLFYWQDLQDLFCDWMASCISFQSITDLILLSLWDVSV